MATTGSITSIPEPNVEGCYSKVLSPKNERRLIGDIDEATATSQLHVVNADNAGQLLFTILTQAGGMWMPRCPSYLLALDGCVDYVKRNPEIVTLLAEVQKKSAYAWLCEYLATTHSASLQETRSPISGESIINDLIAQFQPALEDAIRTYLQNGTELPIWQSQVGTEEVRNHIASLEIPKTSTSSQSPSLLLHNLGQRSHDPHFAECVSKLFAKGFQQRFLCNASGSGKTRLLLEALWRYWGLYFTARTLPEGIGSSDLEELLQKLERIRRLTPNTNENRKTALSENREVASRCFLLILYVRLFVFRVFLECAATMPGGITERHKSRWLLLQLAPVTLLGIPDVFSALTSQLVSVPIGHLTSSIESVLVRVRKLLGSQDLFCVLDEAQVPAEMFSDRLLSEMEQDAPRPILRQLVHEWLPIFPNLIVSGTGISMHQLRTVLGSAVAKEDGPQSEIVTDLGAFDCEEDQRAYLEQYLPPGFLDTESGKALASRAAHWLHAPYGFIATWLSRLIQTGFESPTVC